MIVNWGRLFGFVSKRWGFVFATTVIAGLFGLGAIGAVHLLVKPQSHIQFAISVAGFAALGLLVSLVDSASPSTRASVANAFSSHPLTRREKLLWLVALVLMVGTLVLTMLSLVQIRRSRCHLSWGNRCSRSND